MKKFIIALLLISALVPVARGGGGNGAHVGGFGGAVEYEFAYVAQTIENYVAPCASPSACGLDPVQLDVVKRIRAGESKDLPGALRFDSAKVNPEFPGALYTLQGPLVLINVDKLYNQDAGGEWRSMPFNQVIATVVEIAATRLNRSGLNNPGEGGPTAADLGAKVASVWNRDLVAITLTGSDARLMSIGGSLLVSDNRQVTDLSGKLLASLPCPKPGEKPLFLESVQNLYWDEIRTQTGDADILAAAIGDIRYSCGTSALTGRLRLFLPFENLPKKEIGLLEKKVVVKADSLRIR